MSAYVEHTFEKGFVLDEVTLRKLNEIISKRLMNISDKLILSYHVFRGDSFSYITENIDEVVKEHNDAWRKITKLVLKTTLEEEFNFNLAFSKDGAELEITGTDRDEIYLLYSDLREYVNNEIAIRPKFFTKAPRNITMSIMFLLMIGMVSHMMFNVKKMESVKDPLIDKLLQSQNIHEKLNYILYHKPNTSSLDMFGWMIALLILMFFLLTGLFEKACRYMFPTNVFSIGKMKEVYDSQKLRFSNIFWIILVGLIVSIVGGIVVWKLTQQ